jgi:hypothetical protein
VIKSRVRQRDGRRVYDVRLRDPFGRTYNRTFDTKREAEAYEAAERTARNRGTWMDSRRGTSPFAAVAGEWLGSDATKRGGSIARDRSILRNHVLPALGAKPIGSVNHADVQQLVNCWTASCAPSSVQRMYSCLRAVFSYAEAAELVDRSPCRNIRLPEAPSRRAQILGADELRRLAAVMGDCGSMAYLAALGPGGARLPPCASATWTSSAGPSPSPDSALAATWAQWSSRPPRAAAGCAASRSPTG